MTFLSRLASVEDKVSCLGLIQQELGLMRNEMSNLKLDNAIITTKMHQVSLLALCLIDTLSKRQNKKKKNGRS